MNSGKPSCRVRFGPYELNPEEHVLRKNGIAIRLQEQPWQVLCALLEKPGAVVTREELRKRLWPEGTFVDFEQSLNKAVNKLREALLDSAGKARYIETLARQGYRFVAEVEVETAAEPAVVPPAVAREALAAAAASAKLRGRWPWISGLAAILAALLITGLWPPPDPKTRVTPLTADGRNKWPSVLVAGGRVFYSASELSPNSLRYELWSIPVAGGEPRHEPSPCPRQELYVQIPGAVSYALQRLTFACVPDVGEADLWLAGLDDGNQQWIGRYGYLGRSVPVSPDSETLVFPRQDGLYTRAVAGGPERLLARVDGIELRPRLWRYTEHGAPGPFFHPVDGRIGFQRVMAGVSKLWEIRRDGTGLRPLLPGFAPEQRLARWSPDGRRLYFTSAGDIYLQGSSAWLGWMRGRAPVRLTASPIQFGSPQEDPANPLVVYAQGRTPQAALMKLDRKTNVWEPFLGGLPADVVNFSPDGQWIAYVGWPGGELWKCRKDGSGQVLLEDGVSTFGPRWSPDGSRIAFAARKRGPGSALPPWRIYTVQAGGGKSQPVPGVTGPAFDPTWSPDGKRIAFAPVCKEVPKAQQYVSIVDLATGAVKTVPGSENIFSTRWSPDGRSLVGLTCDNKGWPVVYNIAAQRWSVLAERGMANPQWARDGRGVYGVAEGTMLVRIDVATRKTEEIRKIADFDLAGVYWPLVSWTPDEEPVALKDLTVTQIYRIERGR